MFDNKTESQAREEILGLVEEYCNKYSTFITSRSEYY